MKAILGVLIFSASAWAGELFPTKVDDYTKQVCDLDYDEVKKVEKCLQRFAKGECYSLPNTPEVQEKILSCNINDLQQSLDDETEDFLDKCGHEVVQSYKDLWEFAKVLPSAIFTTKYAKNQFRITGIAHAICLERSGLQQKELTYLQTDFAGPRRNLVLAYNNCLSLEEKRIRKFEGKEDALGFFAELKKGLSCYQKKYWAALGCPIVTDILISGGIASAGKFTAKKVLPIVAKRGKVMLDGRSPAIAQYFDDLEKRAKAPKDKRSVAHQVDITDLAENQYMKDVAERAGLKRQQMLMGMLDSDRAKITGEWVRLALIKSPESDALLNMLKGEGSAKASQAFREILQKNGFGERTFLNRNLTNDELREIIKDNPALQGYLHEAPGMSLAISDLNAGKISVEDFQTRISANLFHNGPHDGFWKDFGEKGLPGSLKNKDQKTKDFFKDTVFDGGKNADGVVTARYPGPISPEGVMHTFTDRMSQGSRGGMMKIWDELGGTKLAENPGLMMKDYPVKGVDMINEMLIVNPTQTLDQLKALSVHQAGMSQLTDSQKSLFSQMIKNGRARMEMQLNYVTKRIEKTADGYKIRLESPEGKVTYHPINGETSASEANQIMERLIKQEERINGNPMIDFPIKPPPKGLFYAAGAATAAGERSISLTKGICEKKGVEIVYPSPFKDSTH